MTEIRKFVLSCSASVDLGVLASRANIAAASMLAEKREMRRGASSAVIAIDALYVPVANIGHMAIGLVYGIRSKVAEGTGSSDTAAVGGNIISRSEGSLMHSGRFFRDERRGEMFHVICDLRNSELATVSLFWTGPVLGPDYEARERPDFLCDASFFKIGRINQGTLQCEHTVRLSSDSCPVSKFSRHSMDFSKVRNNMAFCHMRSQDFEVIGGKGNTVVLQIGAVAVRPDQPIFKHIFSAENHDRASVR